MQSFKSKVIKGKGRGKKIGFPTINIDPVNINIDYGVYLVEAVIDGKKHRALFHFGPKKTFKEEVSAEIHIVDFNPAPFKIFNYVLKMITFKRCGVNLDISPKNVIIKTIKRIRDVKEFKDAGELKKQIKKDIKKLEGRSKK